MRPPERPAVPGPSGGAALRARGAAGHEQAGGQLPPRGARAPRLPRAPGGPARHALQAHRAHPARHRQAGHTIRDAVGEIEREWEAAARDGSGSPSCDSCSPSSGSCLEPPMVAPSGRDSPSSARSRMRPYEISEEELGRARPARGSRPAAESLTPRLDSNQ